MSPPRVSVLLPVWNAGASLGACLESLRRQTLADHEVIAVDDGSSDASSALLQAAARVDDRVLVVSGPHRGLVAALNTALQQARAPLLARMDADDVAHEERLACQAAFLDRRPEIAILGSRVKIAGASTENEGMRRYVAWSNALLDHDAIVRDLFVESPLVHPSVMMRAKACRRLGGYRDFDGPEDYDLWLRAHALGLRFAKTPETLLEWRDAPGRLTRRDARYAPRRFLELKAQALARTHLRPGRALVIWGAGPIGKAWARQAVLAPSVVAFVEVSPRKLGTRIHARPVVPVEEAPRFAGALHLMAVGQPGARERLRVAARALGLVETSDFVTVA